MISDVRKSAEQKMGRSIETLKSDLAKVRTGRAHTGLLDHIHVDYYGTSMPLSQVANVTLADPRTLGVTPWEKKMVPVVEKAIRDSDLGLNPATSGDMIRVPMPPLTEERRKELIKVVHKEAEAAKVRVTLPVLSTATSLIPVRPASSRSYCASRPSRPISSGPPEGSSGEGGCR